LTEGDYKTKKVYGNKPEEIARLYESIGAKQLHIVDLDGAKASAPENLKVLEKIVSATSLAIEWGGGIKTEKSVIETIEAGASYIICGSICVTDPDLFSSWMKRYGSVRMVLGADLRNGMVSIKGWEQDGGISASGLISRFSGLGLRRTICTDISKDGMLEGPSFGLYSELQKEFRQMEITVSGGISSMEDIRKLDSLGLKSVVVGKAIYENLITINDLEKWFQNE
jgi:phosphoribosylformimino-5-aminoimidazole carboxamide ribotide isomerase